MTLVGLWWDARIFMGAYNMSGYLNQVGLNYSADMLDATVFGQGTKINHAGLKQIGMTAAGLTPATSASDLSEQVLFTDVGGVAIPITVMPTNTPVEGDVAYFFAGSRGQYSLGGAHGELYKFSLAGAGGSNGHPLIRGYVLEPGTTARTGAASPFVSTGSNNLGAITATQYLYAVLHVFAMDTPTTIDVTIESDDAGDFGSATTRVTFSQVTTAVSSEYATRVAGPITDTYWRVRAVIAGTSYTFACALGKA